MRILLDENLPFRLISALAEHQADHVELLGLKGTKNGALLDLARKSYDVLVTLDKGILHQHNHRNERLIICVIRAQDSRVESILAKTALLVAAIEAAKPGQLIQI